MLPNSQISVYSNLRPSPRCVQAWLDAGCKDDKATAGWFVLASWGTDEYGVPDWIEVANGFIYVGPWTSMHAEMFAAEQAIIAALIFTSVGFIRLEGHMVIGPVHGHA